MKTYVVCPVGDDKCLSVCSEMCFCVDVCDMTWSSHLCELLWLWLLYLWLQECDLDLLKPVFVPVIMVRCGSSMVSHARMMFSVLCRCTWWWYFVWTVCCNMTIFIAIKTFYMGTMVCHGGPDSWHWKHFSSSLDMTFTVDEGSSVVVNCCAAWSFSTSLMASARFWGPFS